ncbi:MAG: ABC transporter substrate-binding protein [Firmicutes bacterium]|nr:ABC transporter substrate-binding protein [Bacillota bacterium]
MTRKGTIFVMLLMAVVLVVASVASAEPIKIRMYYGVGGAVGELIQELADEFNATRSDIEVEVAFQGSYDETANKVMADLAGGFNPDLAQISLANVPQFIGREELLIDLNSVFEEDVLDDFIPALVDAGTFDGKFYAAPFNVSTLLFYWNKELFEEAGLDPERPPQDWDEMREYARILTKGDRLGLAMFGPPYDHWVLESLYWQNGGNMLSEDGTKVVVDSPASIEALEFIDTLVNEDKTATYVPNAESNHLLLSQRVAMNYASTGALGNFWENADFEFGAGHLPRGPVGKFTSLGGGFLIMFSSTPEREAAAREFLEFLTTTENTVKMNMRTGYLPSRQSAQETAELQQYWEEVPAAKAAVTQLPYAVARRNHPKLKEIHDIIARMMNSSIVESVTTPAEAARRAAQEGNLALLF